MEIASRYKRSFDVWRLVERQTKLMPVPVPLLKLEQVTKQYAARDGAASLAVLSDLSLEVAHGASVAIVGPSGSGKSTLLQIIGTLDQPSSGRVWLDGQNLANYDERQLSEVRNRRIGFVFQAHHLLPQCTVLENVLLPTLALEQPISNGSESAVGRAERLLQRVGLGARQHHRPGQLSGGERQRAAVVRALINRPQLLLADEPTGALDQTSATALGQLLVELNQEEGVTLIVVTHAMELARRMKLVLTLHDGKLIAS